MQIGKQNEQETEASVPAWLQPIAYCKCTPCDSNAAVFSPPVTAHALTTKAWLVLRYSYNLLCHKCTMLNAA